MKMGEFADLNCGCSACKGASIYNFMKVNVYAGLLCLVL